MILQDHVAVITGGGRGIGKAIALRFARAGADIAVVDVDPETAETTAREVRELGRRAVVKAADVADPQAVEVSVTGAVDELGKIDVFVNNAGVETRAAYSRSHRRSGNANST